MSEKRFELRSYGNDEIWEMKDRQGESLLTWGDIEKKLNQLAEENEKLKEEIVCLESNVQFFARLSKEKISDV